MKKNTLVIGNNSASRIKGILHLLMGYNAFQSSPAFRLSRPEFFKPTPRIISVIKITSGRNHAWCESDRGNIRKPIWAIPPGIMAEFRSEQTGGMHG
jgi:hypothetical protein